METALTSVPDLVARIAADIKARPAQVKSAIELLDEGATVPFIARYRKEMTGGLDDTQLRGLSERLSYLRDLDKRRETILEAISEQGALDDGLKQKILAADTKTRLEDLYLPYKRKRRTRAQIAREAGLAPLAESLLADPRQSPEDIAAQYVDVDNGVADEQAALEGARHILIETFSENADLVGELRDRLWSRGQIQARVSPGKEQSGAKFRDYFDHREPIAKTPSHRLLALFRARNEGVLYLHLDLPDLDPGRAHPLATRIAHSYNIEDRGRPADAWLLRTCDLAWSTKIHLHLTLDLFGSAREAAEDEAIGVFSNNLRDLLLASPAGMQVTMGLDPGLRTGVKVAIIDPTGKVVETGTVYPHPPKKDIEGSLGQLTVWCRKHQVQLVAIGNGTGSRETDALVAELRRREPDLKLQQMTVSEAGASVYSASEVAAREFPNLDVSLRGAVSIARRLQDPLAELVKIDPKSIGVGQYQHDVNQVKLSRSLTSRVEDCVNAVGVELNTASAALLKHVAGLGEALAENVVAHREANGPFRQRDELKAVARLGPKAYEQAAGFLRIKQGANPLDASAVHPESYPVVEKMVADLDKPLQQIIGNDDLLAAVDPRRYADDRFGLPTVRDILSELSKPGRDPRGEFKTARFDESITEIKDLKPGMTVEGVVSNVTNFGAFVDVGVHQDGLVHISQLSDKYIDDPRKVVKAGDVVKVRVIEVDETRSRIGLSMRSEPAAGPKPARRESRRPTKRGKSTAPGNKRPARPVRAKRPSAPRGAFGEALAAALKKKG